MGGRKRGKERAQRVSTNNRRSTQVDRTERYEDRSDTGFTVVKALQPKNDGQRKYVNAIDNNKVTVAIGEPGTGKTFIPAVKAAQELTKPNSVYDHIIMVRPNEPLGRALGMLPGDLAEKLEPWLEPIADGIKWAIGEHAYKNMVNRGTIKYLAIEHARGRTFNNAYVIVDEAQNISIEAMMCLVTRVGLDCKLIICGDVAQKDIKANSGLQLLMDIRDEYEYVPFNLIELTDNVRSPESSAFYSIFKDKGLV
ncbi:PhoH-like protein [Pectobacterium phage DU_PP_V]|uniref:PhoH-like protein n=1 Tax=Pectobacterium phage DU_PP_V TaxID=2041492 RepID=A0A2D2W6Y4_9CAUD|nr:PhoH-like phosphate starvation-inducible [Pectobacterium phage DU_PP_V]ATS94061.1 PhoH-like protein [Pectobacterium phage DU_PP_V]